MMLGYTTILSILYIIIGIRNNLVDAFFEWIEERIEVLNCKQVQARNALMFVSLIHETALAEYELWLENDGILLNDKEIDK